MTPTAPVPQQASLCILGSTGSIGVSTLDVARHLGIPVHTLTGHRRLDLLAAQAKEFRAKRVVCADPEDYAKLKSLCADCPEITVGAGPQALVEAAGDEHCPVVMTAIVGGAGLDPTYAAVQAGKRVCIANKEPLVMAGALIMAAARASGATLLPVDSEHSAIFQCLENHRDSDIDRLVLTASGGPFRCRQDLNTVSIAEALKHPNWSMGPKITIDSATLMNKALEVIEAHHLFQVPVEQIEVVIHPQSIVHSMVAFADGSLMAQLGQPDMRTPIQYSLTWPRHLRGPVSCPDLLKIANLSFEAPDRTRFPALDLGAAAARQGGLAPAIFNAANEAAVARFLDGSITFLDIPRLVERALATVSSGSNADPDLASILAADAYTRNWVACA
ncbi:MAG: 1-deoxy-D-xylulose-5-phosphate reductoisomerase [Planctomycetota bacterium]|nr:MAG: 1-deoxy-D-xylulose-5-phosphate reductoisomerase [Planctomycetota bacterium]